MPWQDVQPPLLERGTGTEPAITSLPVDLAVDMPTARSPRYYLLHNCQDCHVPVHPHSDLRALCHPGKGLRRLASLMSNFLVFCRGNLKEDSQGFVGFQHPGTVKALEFHVLRSLGGDRLATEASEEAPGQNFPRKPNLAQTRLISQLQVHPKPGKGSGP